MSEPLQPERGLTVDRARTWSESNAWWIRICAPIVGALVMGGILWYGRVYFVTREEMAPFLELPHEVNQLKNWRLEQEKNNVRAESERNTALAIGNRVEIWMSAMDAKVNEVNRRLERIENKQDAIR